MAATTLREYAIASWNDIRPMRQVVGVVDLRSAAVDPQLAVSLVGGSGRDGARPRAAVAVSILNTEPGS